MEQSLVKREEQAVVAHNADAVRESQMLSGDTPRNIIPFIPKLTVNNKKIKEEDGTTRPPVKGFNITTKTDNGEYKKELFIDKFEGAILRVRYMIQSKNKVEPRYYSPEFDSFNQLITVYNEKREVEFQGNYKEIKEHYKIGEKNGNPVTSFDFFIVLYIDIEGEIYRLYFKGQSRSNYIEYSKQFNQNESKAGYLTSFDLKYNNEGEITFWYIEFTKGKAIPLEPELVLQRKLQEFFSLVNFAKHNEDIIVEDDEQKRIEDTVYALGGKEISDEDDIILSQIPF